MGEMNKFQTLIIQFEWVIFLSTILLLGSYQSFLWLSRLINVGGSHWRALSGALLVPTRFTKVFAKVRNMIIFWRAVFIENRFIVLLKMSVIQNGDYILGTFLQLTFCAFRLLSHQGAPWLSDFFYLFADVDAGASEDRGVPFVHLDLNDA